MKPVNCRHTDPGRTTQMSGRSGTFPRRGHRIWTIAGCASLARLAAELASISGKALFHPTVFSTPGIDVTFPPSVSCAGFCVSFRIGARFSEPLSGCGGRPSPAPCSQMPFHRIVMVGVSRDSGRLNAPSARIQPAPRQMLCPNCFRAQHADPGKGGRPEPHRVTERRFAEGGTFG